MIKFGLRPKNTTAKHFAIINYCGVLIPSQHKTGSKRQHNEQFSSSAGFCCRINFYLNSPVFNKYGRSKKDFLIVTGLTILTFLPLIIAMLWRLMMVAWLHWQLWHSRLYRPMSNTDTEPRWLKNLERIFEFTFKLSFILIAFLSCYIIWMLLLAGLYYLTRLTLYGGKEEHHPKLTYSECADMAGW